MGGGVISDLARSFIRTLGAVALVASATGFDNQSRAADGVWMTNFGEIRLHRFGDYVAGDFGRDGVMAARIEGNCLRGHVLGVPRLRRITSELQGDRLSGQIFDSEGNRIPLGGVRTAERAREFRNFRRDGAATRVIQNDRTVWDGRYASSYGPVDLHARDLFLVGNYGDRGVVVGMWDGNSFQGRFVNDGGVNGWFDFAFFSRDGSFRSGRWGREGAAGGTWTLERRTSGTRQIDNLDASLACDSGANDRQFRTPNELDLAFRDLGVVLHHTRVPFKTSPARFVGHVTADPNWTGATIPLNDTRMATSLGGLVGTQIAPPDVVMSAVTPRGAPGSTCVISYRGTDREGKYKRSLRGQIDEGRIATNRRSDSFSGTQATCTVKKGYLINYEETRGRVMDFLDDMTAKGACSRGIAVVGMSLGGATASLAFADLMVVQRSTVSPRVRDLVDAKKVWLITAGAPRVISNGCAGAIHRHAGDRVTRFIYGSLTRANSQGAGPHSCARYLDPVPGNPSYVLPSIGATRTDLGHFGRAVVGHNTFTGRNPSTPDLNRLASWRCNQTVRCKSKRFANMYARVATRTAVLAFPPDRQFPAIGRDPGASCSGPGLIPDREYMFGRLHDTCSYRNLMAVYGQRHNGEPNQTNHICRMPPDTDDPSNHPHPTCPLGPDADRVGSRVCIVDNLTVHQLHQP